MRAPEQVGILCGRAVCGSGNHLYPGFAWYACEADCPGVQAVLWKVHGRRPHSAGHSGRWRARAVGARFRDRGRRSRRCRRRCSSCGDSRSGRRVGERERESTQPQQTAHMRSFVSSQAVAANIVLRPSPASGPEATPEANPTPPRGPQCQACRHPGASGRSLDFTAPNHTLALFVSVQLSLRSCRRTQGAGPRWERCFPCLALCCWPAHAYISPSELPGDGYPQGLAASIDCPCPLALLLLTRNVFFFLEELVPRQACERTDSMAPTQFQMTWAHVPREKPS